MKILNRYSIFLLLLGGITIYSCVKKPTYPSTPVISYKDFLKYGNPADPDSAELMVTFTDNEGDIGLDQSDTTGLFKKGKGNLIMVYFNWDTTGGTGHWQWQPDPLSPTDTLTFTYRVPPVLKQGDKSQPMKGLIYAKLKAPIAPYSKKIMFAVYMYDKVGHRSNRINTPAISFP